MKTISFSAYLHNPLQLLTESVKDAVQDEKERYLYVILGFLSHEMEGNP